MKHNRIVMSDSAALRISRPPVMKVIANAINIQNGTYIIRLITVDQQHLKTQMERDLMPFMLICCFSNWAKRKADAKCWNKSPAGNSVFKKRSRLEGLPSNHLQMKCLKRNSAQKGESLMGALMFLQGGIWSEQNLVNVLKIWLDLHSNGSLDITRQIQQLIHVYFQLRHLILLQNTEPLMREKLMKTPVEKKSQSE